MCVICIVFAVLGLLSTGTTARNPAGEGCVAALGESCSYTAHRGGGVEAVGNDWHVEIVRSERHIHLGPDSYDDTNDAAVVKRNVIQPGDVVHATTNGVGAPFAGFVSVGTAANGR
jgi:hypothetical protein